MLTQSCLEGNCIMLASRHSTCALPPTRARSYEELAYALKYNKVR